MKTILTFSFLCVLNLLSAQSNRYEIQLNVPGSFHIINAVKDYGTSQLTCGILIKNNEQSFWFAKTSGSNLVWAKSFPATSGSWTPIDFTPTDIIQCNDLGDVVFVGRARDVNGSYSAKIIKVSAAGDVLWNREVFGQPGQFSQEYQNNPLILEEDGVIISMTGRNHLQLMKVDFNGNLVFSKQLKVQGEAVAENPGYLFIPNKNGGYFAGFECDSSVTVVSLNASLNAVWSKKITQDRKTFFRSMTQTESGNILLGGDGFGSTTFMTMLDAAGTVQYNGWFDDSDQYFLSQLAQVNDSIILASGNQSYFLINTATWSYDERNYASPTFGFFHKSEDKWSFGQQANNNYHLDFDIDSPECFASSLEENKAMTEVSATAVDVQYTIVDMGTISTITPVFSTVSATVMNDCSLSVSENKMNDFLMYPNPTASGSVIHFSDVSENVKQLTITDLRGNIVVKTAFENQLSLPQIPAGIYFISLTNSEGNSAVQKIVVE